MATRRKGFKPYVPPLPPAGSYDPGLDAQLAAGQRGLQDLQYDAGLAGARGRTDYELGRGDVQTGFDRNRQDLDAQIQRSGQGYDRTVQDLSAARQRGTEDYQRNTQLLAQSFARLGGRQQESANAAGVLSGGALLQAAAKRAANQGQQQQGLDTSFNRFTADNDQAQQRLGEDRSFANAALDRAGGRLTEDYGSQMGRLGLGYDRQTEDLGTQLARGQREQTALGIDTTAAEAAQAAAQGWAPPGRGEPGGRPRNEFTDALGAYRLNRVGGTIERVRPTGLVDLTRRARRRR